jgi:hypothetical protein
VLARIVPGTNGADLTRTQTKTPTGAQLMRSVKPLSGLRPETWGAMIGAAIISVLGFSIFAWTLGGTADRMAKERA